MQAVPHGTKEAMAFCPVCRQHTLFRAVPHRAWFCTVCGTPNDLRPVATVRSRSKGWAILLLVLVVVGIVWGVGQATATGQVNAQCGGLLSGCTLTLADNGFWPLRLDHIRVDGKPAQGFGSSVTTPFGKATVTLYDSAGHVITTAKTIEYTITAIAGPLSWDQTMTLS